MLSIASAALIVGLWQYEAYIYRGERRIPHSEVELIYEFRADGSDRLFWTIEGEDAFCEREGRYEWTDNRLHNEVLSVHPDNHISCSSDPDMQVGRKTLTPARIHQDELILTLGLGNEYIEMVFQRQK